MLQGSHEEIEKAIKMLSNLLSQFQNFRYNWDWIKHNARELSTVWSIESFFHKKRLHRAKNFFDKLQIYEHKEDKEQCFKIEEFYEVMGLVIG